MKIDELPRRIQEKLKDATFEDHPEHYDGYPQLAVIQYQITAGERKTNRGKFFQHTCIFDNFVNAPTKRYFISFLNMDEVPNDIALKILNEWDQTYPVSIFASKHNLHIEYAFHTIREVALTRFVGPLYYFPMDTISVKKKKIKR